jgi:hypothetical protein
VPPAWANLTVETRALDLRGAGELGACWRRRGRGQWFSLLSLFHFPWTSQGRSPPSGAHGAVLRGRPPRLYPNTRPRQMPQHREIRRRPRQVVEMRLRCAPRRRPGRRVSRSCQNGRAGQPPYGADQPAPVRAPRGDAWRPYSLSSRGGIRPETDHSSATTEWTRRSSQGGRARHALASQNTRTIHPMPCRPWPRCGRQTGDVAERPLAVPQRSPRGRSFHRRDTGTRPRPLGPDTGSESFSSTPDADRSQLGRECPAPRLRH